MFNWTLTQGPTAFVPRFIGRYDIIKMPLYKVRDLSPLDTGLYIYYCIIITGNLTTRHGLKGQKTMNPQEPYKRPRRMINLKSNYTIILFSLFFKMMFNSWLDITNNVINTFYGSGGL